MDDDGGFARRSRDASDLSLFSKLPHNLDAEIHGHHGRILVMVKKDVMTVCPQAAIPAQKFPYEIERGLECCCNLTDRHAAADRGENSR
jgi:hypothetical protein